MAVGDTFPSLLRAVLDQRGLSIRGLARLYAGAGATDRRIDNVRGQLIGWRDGAHSPSRPNRLRLAEVLELPPSYFITRQPPVTLASLDGRLEELAAALRDLADGQEKLLGLLQGAAAAAPQRVRPTRTRM